METLTATGQDHYHEGLTPLPEGFTYVPFGDLAAIEAVMDDDVCGVLIEPIQGEGGVHVPAPGYLEGVKALCEKHDALSSSMRFRLVSAARANGLLICTAPSSLMP